MSVQLTARNADFGDCINILTKQQAAKVDIVTPVVNLRFENGVAIVAGTSVFEDGQRYLPTEICDQQIASKLNIPGSYLRTLRQERIDLYDANVNGWIHGNPQLEALPDKRTVTIRTFQGDPGELGVMRSLLSDRHGQYDNLDILTACFDGIREAGIDIEVPFCDLSEKRIVVKVLAPEIFVRSPQLLDGYRSPFAGKNLPQWARDKFHVNGDGIFAGLYISNSETGLGSLVIGPRVGILSCMNGLMIQKDVFQRRHLGHKLEEGIIEWSGETQHAALGLIKAQAKDAVLKFLDPAYVQGVLNDITGKAQAPVERPEDAIQLVANTLNFSDEARQGILGHFVKGGQLTAGGVLQAVTSYSQEVADPDVAFDMEQNALRVLDILAPTGRQAVAA
jgi:hypothetical protein